MFNYCTFQNQIKQSVLEYVLSIIYCLLDTKHYLKNTLLALGVLTILKFLLMIIMTFVNSRTKSDWRTWPKVLRKPPLTKTNRRRKPRWWKRSWKRLLSSERYVLFAKFTHYIEFWHSILYIKDSSMYNMISGFQILKGERQRCQQIYDSHERRSVAIPGGCAMAAAFATYLGPYHHNFRRVMLTIHWPNCLRERGIPLVIDSIDGLKGEPLLIITTIYIEIYW